jgi:hypothetical protein
MIRRFIEHHRSSLLSLFMLALLLAGVLAAMAVSRLRGAPVQHGVRILELFVQRGLGDLLGAQPAPRWYLAQDARGRAIACLVSVAGATASGAQGMDLVLDAAGLVHTQTWIASLDLSAIQYESRIQSSSGIGIQQIVAAATKSRLQIQLRQPNRRSQSEFLRPANLIPAGLLPSGAGWAPLVARQALADGQAAAFSVLPGADLLRQPDAGTIWLEASPAGDSAAGVTSDTGLRQLYRFNEQGTPREIVWGELVYRLTPAADVITRVPRARALLLEVRRFSGTLWPAQPEEQPSEPESSEPLLEQPPGEDRSNNVL